MAGPDLKDLYGVDGGVPPQTTVDGTGAKPMDVKATPEAFGAGVGEATKNLGDTAQDIVQKYQQIYNTSTARDLVTADSKKLADIEMQYKSNKGLNAATAYPIFQKQAQDLMDESSANIQNPMVREMYKNDISHEVNGAIYRAGDWAASQTAVGQDRSFTDALATQSSLLAMNGVDPVSRARSIANISGTAYEQAHANGLTVDAADFNAQTNVEKGYSALISGLIKTDPDKAMAIGQEALTKTWTVNRPDASGKMVQTQIPYLNDQGRQHLNGMMNQEFASQEMMERQTAESNAMSTGSYNAQAYDAAMTRAGKPQDYRTSQINMLNQKAYSFLGQATRTNAETGLKNDTALAMSGLPPQTTINGDALYRAYPHDPAQAQSIIDEFNNVHQLAGITSEFSSRSLQDNAAAVQKLAPPQSTGQPSENNGINFIIKHEGGYVSNDSGKGPTNFGINQESNPGIDVTKLTATDAAKIIHDKYAIGVGADKMSPAMAAVATDSAVNMGIDKTKTLLAQAGNDPQKLIDLRRAEYQRLATANPEKYGQYLKSWNNRLDDLQKELPNISATPAGNFSAQSRVYTMAQQAFDTYRTNLLSDPAGTIVSKDPNFTNAINDAVKDPTKMGTYIDNMKVRQNMLGVPEGLQSAIPKSVALDMVGKITASPAASADAMNQMVQQYGQHWPQVYHSLVKQGDLPPVYQSIAELGGHPDTASDAKLLATISGEDTKGKTYKDLLGDKTITGFQTTIQSDPKWTQLRDSLANGGASPEQVDGVYHSIEALAAAKQFYNKDPQAAQNALDSFDKHNRYMPDGGARVPEDLFSRTQNNARYVLDNIDKFAHESTPYATGFHGRMKPQDYYSWLQGSHSWVNTASGDGMLLRDPNNQVVLGKNGKPLIIQFSAPSIAPSIPHGADTEGSDLLRTIGK